MTACPLLFYVPYNDQFDTSLDKMDQNLKKGIKILEAISKFLKKPEKEKVISEMDRLLYIPFNNNNNLFEILLNEIIELKCPLNRFPSDDGFENSSSIGDIKTKNIINGGYGHRYLDSRHMLTILLGSQTDPTYRYAIRKPLKDLIKEIYNADLIKKTYPDIITQKLQIFTRLKIALYEGLKLNKECQTEIKTVISNLQKKGIIESNEEVDEVDAEAEQRAKKEAEQRAKAKKEAEQRKKIKALVNSNHTNKTCEIVK